MFRIAFRVRNRSCVIFVSLCLLLCTIKRDLAPTKIFWFLDKNAQKNNEKRDTSETKVHLSGSKHLRSYDEAPLDAKVSLVCGRAPPFSCTNIVSLWKISLLNQL